MQQQTFAEVQPMFGRANVRDVGHPFGVGSRGREVARYQVARGRMVVSPTTSCVTATAAVRPASGLAHQAGHPMAGTALAGVTEFLPHPWAHDHAIVLRVHVVDARHEKQGRRKCEAAVTFLSYLFDHTSA
jgi:hypothetical protein